ncbi:MAG TPA: hypothetical protein VFM05_01325, partial [Candidatus Saccharimonadales bacterium]|nr:hypothetical protein [Candidatus Saccharimonadales bacterium]
SQIRFNLKCLGVKSPQDFNVGNTHAAGKAQLMKSKLSMQASVFYRVLYSINTLKGFIVPAD